MNRTVIKTKNAPSAVGAYNQGIKVNGLIYTKRIWKGVKA